ncbi:MAG: SDR family oxidoreductase [Pseudomonadota bacterium]
MTDLANMRLGIFGAGFSGKHIGALAADRGASVWGTTRSKEKFDQLSKLGIKPMEFDGETIGSTLSKALQTTTHLVISVAPPRDEGSNIEGHPVDPVLQAFADQSGSILPDLKTLLPRLEWVCYLSTVGVYGNYDGAWIDEEAGLQPTSSRSRQRVRAEQEWQTVCAEHGIPLAIFRLSGIYGPGRNALVSADRGKSRRLVKPGQVFNRIHAADIAQAVALGMPKASAGVFNITDNEPAPPQDVVAHAHALLGTEPPPELDFATAELSPMARSFYGENKRVSNQRSKTVLGMSYAYPNYREALDAMYADGSWRG